MTSNIFLRRVFELCVEAEFNGKGQFLNCGQVGVKVQAGRSSAINYNYFLVSVNSVYNSLFIF
jgi:hypothetical protein